MYIHKLLQYKEHLTQLEAEIDALVQDIEEYQIIKFIQGIGEKIEATIISEMGGIDRLNDSKKLIALGGVDPSALRIIRIF